MVAHQPPAAALGIGAEMHRIVKGLVLGMSEPVTSLALWAWGNPPPGTAAVLQDGDRLDCRCIVVLKGWLRCQSIASLVSRENCMQSSGLSCLAFCPETHLLLKRH